MADRPVEGFEVLEQDLALAARGIGEGGDDIVPPGNDPRLRHPALRRQPGGAADLQPLALPRKHIKGLEGRIGRYPGSARGAGARRAGPCEDALVNRACAFDEQGAPLLGVQAAGRHAGSQHPGKKDRCRSDEAWGRHGDRHSWQ